MQSFHDYLKLKLELHIPSEELRQDIVVIANKLSHMQPQDVEDVKDVLLELRQILDEKLSGL